MRTLAQLLVAGWTSAVVVSGACAKVLVTPEEAVKEAFNAAPAEKRTDYLTDDQAAKIAALAGSPPSSKIVISWSARKDDHPLGTAYLETHLVRTLPETILVVVDPLGKVGKVEILSFDEPDEYRPRTRWLEQFQGRPLDAELSLRTGIHGITGATLSSRAIAAAVRRVLATHRVLGDAKPSPTSTPAASTPVPRPDAPNPQAPPPGAQAPPPRPEPPSPRADMPRSRNGASPSQPDALSSQPDTPPSEPDTPLHNDEPDAPPFAPPQPPR